MSQAQLLRSCAIISLKSKKITKVELEIKRNVINDKGIFYLILYSLNNIFIKTDKEKVPFRQLDRCLNVNLRIDINT